MFLEIVLTFFLVFLNGFFVAAEFAIVKVRAAQIELRIASGNKLAVLAKNMLEHLDAYLSATQLGITIASLSLGWIGESVVSQVIISILEIFGITLPAETAHRISYPIAFLAITFLHIVFGELAPKSLAIQRSEAVTLAVSLPMRFFYIIFKPFIWLLNGFANYILRLIGIEPVTEHEVHSVEELRFLLEQGKESGAIHSSEHELIENVFYFTERIAKQVMVSRTHIVALDISVPTERMLEIVIEEGYSRLPVYRDSMDNIIGIVYTKDILTMMKHRDLIILQDILRPAYFVPETKKISNLLREFQRQKIQMAVVLDEFGGTAGIITIEDILEELVGEIQDEYDEEQPFVTKVSEDEFIVNALSSINDVNDFLPKPLPQDKDYDTVGGMLNVIFGRIPDVHEIIDFAGYSIEILRKTRRNIELTRFTLIQESEEQDSEENE